MPAKRSQSQEREKKRLQRLKLTEEKKAEIRINDAKSKNMKRKCETEEVTRERLESASTYNEKIPQKNNLSEKLEKKRRKRRLGKSIGIEDGLAMSWVTKKMNDMNVEEKQEYAKHRKRQSRENDSKEKKIAQNIKKREYNYERRFARYRQAKTRDLRDSDEDTNETNGEFLQRYLKWKETDTKKYKFKLSEFEEKALQKIKGDNEDEDDTSDFSEQEDDEPYWMDKENDEECINEEKLNPGI